MYHIIELENGQPMIFEQSARQIKSYLIANGRVFSKGYVFKDFKKDFNVYSVNSPLVSYYSVDNSLFFIWIIHLWEFVQTILPRNIVLSKTYPAQIISLLLYIIIAFLLQLTIHFMKSTWILMWFVSRKLIFLWIIWLMLLPGVKIL